jgi:hypothetical protein
MLAAKEDTCEVHIDDALPLLDRRFVNRTGREDAGVVQGIEGLSCLSSSGQRSGWRVSARRAALSADPKNKIWILASASRFGARRRSFPDSTAGVGHSELEFLF